MNWIHIANVLFLISYLVRDMLWLRLINVLATCALIPYYANNYLGEAIAWNGLFLAINAFQIKVLLAKRLPVLLDDRQQALYAKAFRALSPREFSKLLGCGMWMTANEGATLIEQGRHLDELMVIHRGKVEVLVGETAVATLGVGQFIGEMSFLTGDPTSATVRAIEEVEYVAWLRADIDKCLGENPEIKAPLQVLLGADVVQKLKVA